MITDVDLDKFRKEQLELAKKVECCSFDVEVRYVCGVDVSYWSSEDGTENYACSAIVYDVVKKKVIERTSSSGKVTFPYISGFLSYREFEIEMQTIKKLHTKFDLLFVDGNGILHERGAGIAVRLGVELNLATIGISKLQLKLDNLKYEDVGHSVGSTGNIYLDKKLVGKSVRTTKNGKSVYVSVGNKITLEDAVYWVLKLSDSNYYNTAPICIADAESKFLSQKLRNQRVGKSKCQSRTK
jgi:deoxyribonuclease V